MLQLPPVAIDRCRVKTQWNWGRSSWYDRCVVAPALATGRCWNDQEYILKNIRSSCCTLRIIQSLNASCEFSSNDERWTSEISQIISQVVWVLASPASPCTCVRDNQQGRKVDDLTLEKSKGLRVHPFFPKRGESSGPADTTWPKKKHLITDGGTSFPGSKLTSSSSGTVQSVVAHSLPARLVLKFWLFVHEFPKLWLCRLFH